PCLFHEAAIEIRPQTVEVRVLLDATYGASSGIYIGRAIKEQISYSREQKGLFALAIPLNSGRLGHQLPPGITFSQQCGCVLVRPHPGRVSDLQIESPALRKNRCEEEFPVEEPLLSGDAIRHRQPRVFRTHVFW